MHNVLIVDDWICDRALYKEFLASENYNFFELDDGDQVLDLLQLQPIDVIILDWQLPRMNGLETLKALKSSSPFADIPVIVITGLDEEVVMKDSFENGSVDFIYKPVSSIELNVRMNNILRQSNKLACKTELISEISHQQEQLKSEIANKQAKLASLEVNSDQIFSNLKEIKQDLQKAHVLLKSDLLEERKDAQKILRKVNHKIEKLNDSKQNWNEIKDIYQTIESEFIHKLSDINSKLTTLDIKHCLYMKMNLENHEIATILNIAPRSVHMRAYRLRKKLNLSQDQDLRAFILNLV